MVRLWIKDTALGGFHEYGTNPHDSLVVKDGALYYYNLQCGEGSMYGGFQWCDSEGNLLKIDEDAMAHGICQCYADIGGDYYESGKAEEDAKKFEKLKRILLEDDDCIQSEDWED